MAFWLGYGNINREAIMRRLNCIVSKYGEATEDGQGILRAHRRIVALEAVCIDIGWTDVNGFCSPVFKSES